jgi:alpha-tubulin suppressor-like RCC1 family protein
MNSPAFPPPDCTLPLAAPHPVKLTLRSQFACALFSDGSTQCWGANFGGIDENLGLDRLEPVRVLTASCIVDVAVGASHSCALMEDGKVRCWGDGFGGALGDGSMQAGFGVATAAPLEPARAIFAGSAQSAAISRSGELFTWGRDVGLTAIQLVPTRVPGLTNVENVMLGPQASCAVANHRLYCWGDDFYGQLGDGSMTLSRTLRSIPFSADVLSVGIGYSFACALLVNGEVWCWGKRNSEGQLGDDSTVGHFPPQKVPITAFATQLAVGIGHTCVLYEDGRVACWGGADVGALGTGKFFANSPTPEPMLGVANAIQVVAGGLTTCVLTADHEVFCCGQGVVNGDGTGEDRSTPVKVKFAP